MLGLWKAFPPVPGMRVFLAEYHVLWPRSSSYKSSTLEEGWLRSW